MGIIGTVAGTPTETATLGYAQDQNYNVTIGGTVTTGDVVSLTVENSSLAGGQTTVSYTVPSGATTTSIATGLASAVDASTSLATLGVAATASSSLVSLHTDPYFTTSTSVGATETLTVGTNKRGNTTVTVGGTPHTGDTLTITTNYASLSGGAKSDTYIVLLTDTLQSIANALTAVLTADTSLQAISTTKHLLR